MGGAILAELLVAERLRAVQVKKKKHLVEVVDATPLGEPLLDECLGRVAAAKRRASLETWVSRFAGLKGLKHRVAASLVDRGVLRAERDTVMLLFSRTVYPEADPGPERELEARLEAAIFGDGTEIGPRTVVMIALAKAADLLRHHFDKRALKGRQARIEALVNGDLTGAATAAAIQAAETATSAWPDDLHPLSLGGLPSAVVRRYCTSWWPRHPIQPHSTRLLALAGKHSTL